MERDLKEIQELLYNADLSTIEKNLDKFIEAKHQHLKEKHNQNKRQ